MKPLPRKESAEQAAIIKLLDSCGFIVWPTSEGRAVRRPAGLPDLYALHPGYKLSVWVEVKRQRLGVVSPEQQMFQQMHYPGGDISGLPFAIIGGEDEVRDWLEGQCIITQPGCPMYHEWHRVRLEEMAKRKAKKRRTKLALPPRQKRPK